MKQKMFSMVAAAMAIAFVLSAVPACAENCTATNVVVEPLTDAHWTQGAPYNDYSPKGTTAFGDNELAAPKNGPHNFYRVRVGARRSDLE